MKHQRILSFVLVLMFVLSWTVPAMAAEAETESAAAVQLTKTSGDVTVTKSSGKTVSMRDGMRLYDGYNVTTDAASYAWINLDSSKLIKLDASSSAEIRKKGKLLEVNVSEGSAFFEVSEKLDSSENLNIRTSTMAAGIRGTSGWLSVKSELVSELHLLDGECECAVCDPVTRQTKTGQLKGGQMASCVVYPQDKAGDKCDIMIGSLSTDEIPGFVLTELVGDIPLCDTIRDDSGLDILSDLAAEAGGNPSGRSDDGYEASPEVIALAEQRLAQAEEENAARLERIRNAEAQLERRAATDNVWGAADAIPGTDRASSRRRLGARPAASVAARPTSRPAASSRPAGTAAPTAAVQPTQASSAGPTTQVSARPSNAGPSQTERPSSAPAQTARPTETAAPSSAPTVTAQPTPAPTATSRPTATAVPSTRPTPTATAEPTPSPSPSVTASPAPSPSPSSTQRPTPSPTPSRTQRPTTQPTRTASPTTGPVWTPGPAPTRTATAWPTPTLRPVPSFPILPTASPLPTPTIGPTTEPTPSLVTTPSPTVTPSPAATRTPRPSSGAEPSGTATLSPSPSPSAEPSATATPEPSPSSSAGPAETATSEPSPSSSAGPAETATSEPAPSLSSEPTSTITPPVTPSAEMSPSVSAEPSASATTDPSPSSGAEPSASGVPEPSPSASTAPTLDPVKTVTFVANGGTISGSATQLVTTNQDGYLSALPAAVRPDGANGGYWLIGWYTAADGGTEVTTATKFEEDAVVYARWGGWMLDNAKLTVFGDGPMPDITNWSNLPWGTDIQTVVIEPGVTKVGNYAFWRCAGLTTVSLPETVTTIGTGAFGGCANLEAIVLPTALREIGASAFNACDSLRSMKIPDGVTRIEIGTFYGCDGLTHVEIPEGVTSIGKEAFYVTGLTEVNIPASVASLGERAFHSCTELKEVTIGTGLTTLGDQAFSLCTALQSIDLPVSTTSIGAKAFEGCANLTAVTIPGTVTSIGKEAFLGCKNLGRVEIPDTVTRIEDGTFRGCGSLADIALPGGLESIGPNAFEECGSLQSITLPDSVTTIGRRAFYACVGLKSVGLPAGLQTIAEGTLSYCSDLENISIPGAVASIESYAFAGCTSLTHASIPASVTVIEANAFDGCPLGQVEYTGTTDEWKALLQACPDTGLSDKTVKCSDGTFEPDLSGQELGTVTVELDAAGGTVSPTACQTDEEGKLSELPDPAREGYSFDGWFTAADGGEPVTADTVFRQDTTICAHWTEDEMSPARLTDTAFTIELDGCGGTLKQSSLETDVSGKLANLPKPTRDGYVFDGWYAAKTGGKEISRETQFTKDAVIFAHWTADTSASASASQEASYSVTFDACGGSVSPESAKTGEDGKLGTLPKPTWKNHTFAGWFTAKTGGTKIIKSTVFTADATVYAHWNEEQQAAQSAAVAVFTVRFEAGSGGADPASMKTDKDGRLSSLPVPEWKNHTFTGWYTESEGGRKVSRNTVFEKDTNLYARWEEMEADSALQEEGAASDPAGESSAKLETGSTSASQDLMAGKP